MRFVTAPIILSSVLLVAACANKPLHDLDARRNTPDEFLVLPNKPLEQPESYAALPQPTPVASIAPTAIRKPRPSWRWAGDPAARVFRPLTAHW